MSELAIGILLTIHGLSAWLGSCNQQYKTVSIPFELAATSSRMDHREA